MSQMWKNYWESRLFPDSIVMVHYLVLTVACVHCSRQIKFPILKLSKVWYCHCHRRLSSREGLPVKLSLSACHSIYTSAFWCFFLVWFMRTLPGAVKGRTKRGIFVQHLATLPHFAQLQKKEISSDYSEYKLQQTPLNVPWQWCGWMLQNCFVHLLQSEMLLDIKNAGKQHSQVYPTINNW